MKLSQVQLKQAYNDVVKGHHEAVSTIQRYGGDKEDYQTLYEMLRGFQNK